MPVNTSGIYIPGKLKIEDATANSSDVMNGKVFYNNNGRQVGTFSFSGNATAADVLSGRTFYSNDSNIKTGSMYVETVKTYTFTVKKNRQCSKKL